MNTLLATLTARLTAYLLTDAVSGDDARYDAAETVAGCAATATAELLELPAAELMTALDELWVEPCPELVAALMR